MNSTSSVSMNGKIFGDFLENLPSSKEYLIVSFSPSSAPLQKRWRNNGLSANFLADYLSSFLGCEEKDSDATIKYSEVKDAIAYIANELLENAMKYNNRDSTAPITIQIHSIDNKIIFQITNSIHEREIKALQNNIQELISCDPHELYITKLERNAIAENGTASGLGFLTMLNDYGAILGWRFNELVKDYKETTITTMVQIMM